MNGAVLLARTAAADMYPPERRARDLCASFGALFGAASGRSSSVRSLAGSDLELDTLVIPWFAVAAIAFVGMLVSLYDPARPANDCPRARARGPGCRSRRTSGPAAGDPARPGVPSAVIAALASFAVMVSVMNLSGYIVVGHDHEQADVFTVISLHRRHVCARARHRGAHRPHRAAHVPGLGARDHVRVDGDAGLGRVDRLDVGRSSCSLGWNLSYVAASAELVTHATPVERGRLVGFTDLTAGPRRVSRCSAAPCTRSGGGRDRSRKHGRRRRPRARAARRKASPAAALEPTG